MNHYEPLLTINAIPILISPSQETPGDPRRPQETPGDPRRPHEVEAAPLESPKWGAPALLQWISIDFDGISMAVAQGVQESIESLLPSLGYLVQKASPSTIQRI